MKLAVTSVALVAMAVLAVSCGSSSSSTKATASGLSFRAFVSQDVSLPTSTTFPSGVAPGLFVIDAQNDVKATSFISTSNLPGMLVLDTNKKLTLAYGMSDNSVAIVNNASESSSTRVGLPGFSESIVLSPDASTAYAAVISATFPLGAFPPGAVEVMNLGSASITNTIPVQNAHYVMGSHNGNRLLVFSDNSDSVSVIATGNIAGCTPTCTSATSAVAGFDRPVGAVFSSDDSTAYVLNCGAQCGGHQASVQAVDMTTQTLLGAAVPVDAATAGLLSGSTLYVAGTPPSVAGTPPSSQPNACTGASTLATTCGRLDVVDLGTMKVTSSKVITDGYHNRMDLSGNGQLFVGARQCTNINMGGEVRGCLSIFNTVNGAVVIPPATGDVTGVQAISNRNVVYVAQAGALSIYDTTIDKLGPIQLQLIGQVIDVKQVDF